MQREILMAKLFCTQIRRRVLCNERLMKQIVEEKMQIEFNMRKMGFKPRSIEKVWEILEKVPRQQARRSLDDPKSKTLSDDILNIQPISNIALEIKKLEEKMYKHAKNLEFEDAARVRDLLTRLRERSIAS